MLMLDSILRMGYNVNMEILRVILGAIGFTVSVIVVAVFVQWAVIKFFEWITGT